MRIRPLLRPPFGSATLPLLLLLVVAGALAWRAWDAARDHRRAARRTVLDYADFAATTAAANLEAALAQTLVFAFYRADLADRRGSTAPVPAEALATNPPEAERCQDAYPDGRWFARLAPGEELEVAGPLAPAGRARVTEALRRVLADAAASSPYGNLFPTTAGLPPLVTYRVRRLESGAPLEVHALAGCFETGRGLAFPLARDQTPLLPPTLVGNGPADSLLTLVVRDPNGRVVYRSPVAWESEFRGRRPAPAAGPAAGLEVEVVLRPEVAGRLVAGGIPAPAGRGALWLLLLAGLLGAATLAQLRRSAALVRLRERFVADVSHELRTPLQQILLFSQLLRLGRLRDDAERRESLAVVERETLRLIRLVDRVLTFSRLDRHDPARAAEPSGSDGAVDLEAAARRTVEDFQALAEPDGAELRVEVTGDVPPARLSPDAARQVLLNLLDNAVKYGPPGQPVRVRLDAPGGRPRLSVEDRGPGIPPADRERVWQAFQRLERERRSGRAGSGIGLAVVRELVEAAGGRTAIEEAEGGGARVVVELRPAAAPAAWPSPGGAEGSPTPVQRRTAGRT